MNIENKHFIQAAKSLETTAGWLPPVTLVPEQGDDHAKSTVWRLLASFGETLVHEKSRKPLSPDECTVTCLKIKKRTMHDTWNATVYMIGPNAVMERVMDVPVQLFDWGSYSYLQYDTEGTGLGKFVNTWLDYGGSVKSLDIYDENGSSSSPQGEDFTITLSDGIVNRKPKGPILFSTPALSVVLLGCELKESRGMGAMNIYHDSPRNK